MSAVADDIGETVYSAVGDYIGQVSYVDTCSVKALRSMMNELGFDRTALDQIDQYPDEVLKLMDLVSVNRKRLLDPKYAKKAFVQAVSAFADPLSPPLDSGILATDSNLPTSALYQEFRHGFSVSCQAVPVPGICPDPSVISGDYRLKDDWGYIGRTYSAVLADGSAEQRTTRNYAEETIVDGTTSAEILTFRTWENGKGCRLKRFVLAGGDIVDQSQFRYGLFCGSHMIGHAKASDWDNPENETFEVCSSPDGFRPMTGCFSVDPDVSALFPSLVAFSRLNEGTAISAMY